MQATGEIRETLALYAFGLLDAREARELESHFEGGCAVCQNELRELRKTAAELPWAMRQAGPHPRVREKLLRRIHQSSSMPEQPIPGIYITRQRQGQWRATPFRGVSFQPLYTDSATQQTTSFLRLEPGAKYPAHHHAGVEQCLVLEGACRMGAISLHEGDFEYALAGTDHDVVQSDRGCLLLIISSNRDEVFV